ncbi:MAG: hypothetical protein NTV86_09645 [Planctomycetota bacterium]|nr:hypothetical protein [Planctomycetota bacterium]
MTGRGDNLAARAAERLGLTGGAAMMTGRLEGCSEAETSRVFAPAWIGLAAIALAWGLLSIGVYVVARLATPERFVCPLWTPAVALAALSVAGPFRVAALDVAALLHLRGRVARAAFGLLLAGGWAWALAYLGGKRHFGLASEEQALPGALAWIRPEMEAFRVLLLAPLWGAWAMMIAVQFRRPGRELGGAVREFAAGCGPMLSVVAMGVVSCWNILYFSFLPWGPQLAILGGAIGGGVVAGLIARALAGGLTRGSLLAANLGAQGAFLGAYLANVPR